MLEQSDIYPYRTSRSKSQAKVKYGLTGIFTLRGFALLAAGFLLARVVVLGELVSFGPAYFATVASLFPWLTWPLAAVMSAGAWSVTAEKALSQIAVFIALGLVINIYRFSEEKRGIILPVIVALSVFLGRTYYLASMAGDLYRVVVTLFEVLLAAGLTYVFLLAGPALRRGIKSSLSSEEVVCLLIFALGLLAGLRGWQIGPVGIQGVVSRFFLLLGAVVGGIGGGAALGTVVGLAPGLWSVVAPSFIGLYGFTGLFAGLLSHFNRTGVIVGSFLGTLILSVYIIDQQAIWSALMENAIAGALLFMVPVSWIDRMTYMVSQAGAETAVAMDGGIIPAPLMGRMTELASLVRGIGSSLSSVEVQDNPLEEDKLTSLFNRVARGVCQGCPVYRICWEERFSQLYKDIMALFSKAMDEVGLVEEDMNPILRRRCPRSPDLVSFIDWLGTNYRVNRYWQQRFADGQQLVARQLDGVASILEDLTGNGDKARIEILTGIARDLEALGFDCHGIDVTPTGIGKMEVYLTRGPCRGDWQCEVVGTGVVSRYFGEKVLLDLLQCPYKGGQENGDCSFRFLPASAFTLEIKIVQASPDGNAICGDKVRALPLKGGREGLIISDGMGIGLQAAQKSNKVVSLLANLLSAGFSPELAVNSVNEFLALRSRDEIFATIDLAVVNLLTGEIEMLKVGAAPTFIKNSKEVETISGEAPPAGILHGITFFRTSSQLAPGDMLVLVSDGILDTERTGDGQCRYWVKDFLTQLYCAGPGQVAEFVLEEAQNRSGGKPRDDLTVLVAQLQAREE